MTNKVDTKELGQRQLDIVKRVRAVLGDRAAIAYAEPGELGVVEALLDELDARHSENERLKAEVINWITVAGPDGVVTKENERLRQRIAELERTTETEA